MKTAERIKKSTSQQPQHSKIVDINNNTITLQKFDDEIDDKL